MNSEALKIEALLGDDSFSCSDLLEDDGQKSSTHNVSSPIMFNKISCPKISLISTAPGFWSRRPCSKQAFRALFHDRRVELTKTDVIEYFPALHNLQSPELAAPSKVKYLPDSQILQLEAPLLPCQVPKPHAMHSDHPKYEYFPALQYSQVVNPSIPLDVILLSLFPINSLLG